MIGQYDTDFKHTDENQNTSHDENSDSWGLSSHIDVEAINSDEIKNKKWTSATS